jgi:Fe-S cluster assembly ATP-binding protein
MLEIKNFKVRVGTKIILQGISLKVKSGEVVAVMGPNGSGKSTLAYSLVGQPKYEIVSGKVNLNGKDLLKLSVEERAKKGLFLGWQNPVEIRGMTVEQLLRAAKINCRCEVCDQGGRCMNFGQFREYLEKKAKMLNVGRRNLRRAMSDGFSGGEKKKLEILQMMVLEPNLAILDEIDSGLDIDALKIVARGVNKIRKEKPQMGVLLITHYQRVLKHIKPDRVIVMKKGRIVMEDGPGLVGKLEREGYEGI